MKKLKLRVLCGALYSVNTVGITQTKLEAGKQLVTDVESANFAQKKEKGKAQQATVERDGALDVMEDWKSDIFTIARIALEDRPQLLEKMGIIKPS